jgi:flagellar protein FlaJ
MVVEFVPLGVVGLLVVGMALIQYSVSADRAFTRVALALFGQFARERASQRHQQRQWLDGAHVPATYRVYASKTYLYATIAAVAGSVLGVYAIAGALVAASSTVLMETLPGFLQAVAVGPEELGLLDGFVLILLSSATVGVLSGYVAYRLRWALPQYESGERRRRIDSSLKRNVAFMFALSRSGMPFPKILGILADNRAVYGETADEVTVAVKDLEYFGSDVLSAIQRLRDRTPSQHLEELAENLSSVLQSGQSLSAFLEEQYEFFKNEEEAQQQAFLELLSTLAEAYVTVFVAGPLFLITILVVIGLMLGGTLEFLRALVYLILPLATFGFVIYLDSITEDSQVQSADGRKTSTRNRFPDVRVVSERSDVARTDGGTETLEANRYRLEAYKTLKPLLDRLRDPVRIITEHPTALLWVTVPLAVLFILVQWWPHLLAGNTDLATYDDAFVLATLFVVGTFAITFEVANRRVKALESAIPDFLDRMAATNEAGMSIVESFERVVTSELGALSKELRRTWADIVWGARVEDALLRMQYRVETPAVTRVVTLTRNAMSATNDIGQVLRIAADEAQAAKRLERERRNELLAYTVVVYLSFFVFLVIVVALEMIFVPAIPTAELGAGTNGAVPGGGLGGGIQAVTAAEKEAYSLVFFHAALVQAGASGFVAGQMGEGSIKAGAKHSTVMLAIAYAIFLVIG